MNTLVDNIVDRVSKNGNTLLNIAPRPDGIIPEEQKERLLGRYIYRYRRLFLDVRAQLSWHHDPVWHSAAGPGDGVDSFEEKGAQHVWILLYGDDKIIGFNHMRLEGTGAVDGGHFLVIAAMRAIPKKRYTDGFYIRF